MAKPPEKCKWLEFYTANLSAASMIGYETQIKAATSIALSTIDGNSKSVLAFGFPGNGKTLFPEVLAYHLEKDERVHFSLAIVSCDQISVEVSNMKKNIEELNKMLVKAHHNKPVIICFDEVDRLCPNIGEVPFDYGAFSAWVRCLLKDKDFKSGKMLILGITNNPSKIESSVKRQFEIPLYFEPTPIEISQEIIRKNLINNDKIAEEYMQFYADFHFQPMGAEVMSACKAVKKIYKDISSVSEDEIIKSMKANTPIPPSEGELESYEQDNTSLIGLSKGISIPYWLDLKKQEGSNSKQ